MTDTQKKEKIPRYIPTSEYEKLGDKKYRYDEKILYYKYIDNDTERNKKQKLLKNQEQQQKEEEIRKQARREEINQPSYTGLITSYEYSELIAPENKQLWVGIDFNQHDSSFTSYRKIREEEKVDYKLNELKSKIADTSNFTVKLTEEDFKKHVPLDQHDEWKLVASGPQWGTDHNYMRKTQEDIKSEERFKISNEMEKALKQFMKENAKKHTITTNKDLPNYSIQTDKYEYYTFKDKSLYEEYKAIENEYTHKINAISGGKSKKKRSYIKKKASRRYGVKSNKSHKRK